MNGEKSSSQINESNGHARVTISIAVPFGWQRRILSSDLVVYLSPSNAILDSFASVRRYLEMPNSCKCGLQCPLIVEKVFNFDPSLPSKCWEVTQVFDGTHCRQKSNILEMATLTNCIDSFGEHEEKAGISPRSSSKRPRGRPRKSTQTSPNGKIDFNDPSTTNFLLSAFASGATPDSNALVQRLIEKALQPSRLDDAGPCLIVQGLVQPRTLSSLLKNLRNSSSFSGVEHLIATIEKFEQTTPTGKKPVRRRATTKKLADESPMRTTEVMLTPIHADVHALDFASNSWPNDPNLNSLLFHEDFHFDDFDSYLTVEQSSSSASEPNLIFASHLL